MDTKNKFDVGDGVGVRKARINPKTKLGEEFWMPATVGFVRDHVVSVIYADGKREDFDPRQQRSLLRIKQHKAAADRDVQLAILIAHVLINCDAGGAYGPGCFVDDDDSGPTSVRIDGIFNLVDAVRKARERLEATSGN